MFRADIEQEYQNILREMPFWGISMPREWHSFMLVGKGQKCINAHAEPCIWTLHSARSVNRAAANREEQRQTTKTFRQHLQIEANAEAKAK